MLRKLTPLITAVALFTPAVAHADVVQTAPGVSVSATTVVSGTVQAPTQRPDSYVKG